MGGDDAPLPFHVAGGKGFPQRVLLEQQAKLGDFAQLRRSDRRHLETALAFREHEIFRRQPVQDLPQRADANAIDLAHRIEPQLLSGRKATEQDIGTQALVGTLAGGLERACIGRHAASIV